MLAKLKSDEIQAAANRFARLLDDSGVPVRGVVAAILPNCPEFIFCLRGATWSGRTFTPVNSHLKTPDIRYIVENSEACALVIHADLQQTASQLRDLIGEERRFVVGGEIEGFRPFGEGLRYPSGPLEHPLAGAIMMYTSGTTGRPKGVKPAVPEAGQPPCATSAAGMMLLQHFLDGSHDGPHLVVAPLYHAAPSTYAEGAALLGGDVVIMEKWDAEAFLRTVEEEKILSTFLVPTHFVRLLQLPEETRSKYDTSSLRFVCHGAAPVSVEVKRQMIAWLGPVLFEFYGGTEGGGICISSREWLEHPGSVGKPRPDLPVYILDEDQRACDPGVVGNIYFQATAGRFEYKDDPGKTAAAYSGDKYTLGDMGYLDADGYLYLCDRKADTIISGGVNIYPAEVEAALLAHGAVGDCCVVGVLDPEWGERVVAAVQLVDAAAEGESVIDSIRSHCQQTLAAYQVPREFRIEESLPRTAAGKLQRREIRDRYRKRQD